MNAPLAGTFLRHRESMPHKVDEGIEELTLTQQLIRDKEHEAFLVD